MIVRRPTAADAAAVAAIGAAYDLAHFGESEVDEAEVRDWWRDLDLERDAWLLELDGAPVAYAALEEHGPATWLADVYVHPAAAGRGVGTRCVDLTEARAAELAAATIRNATLAADEAGVRLLESRGYRPHRHFFRMVLDLGDEPPPAPAAIEGIEIGPFERAREARAVHAAIQEAFAHEWGFRPETFEAWTKRRLEAERFDEALWLVARDGGEVAGVSVNDWKRFGGGWIGGLAVREPWRRRGIGEALLRASFREFHRRGERRVALGVDADNPTGATRLYERVGMRVLFQAIVFERALGR